jgi:hypothetical protein
MLSAVLIAVAVFQVPVPAQPGADTPSPRAEPVTPATVALVETWPDGRTVVDLTTSRPASAWTPMFSKVNGYKLPEGSKPVYAVQLARILDGQNIKVDVSVLLGSAEPPGMPVASVIVSPGSHIVVEGLTRFGVQPVTLSMVEVAALTPYPPTVSSVSPDIEVANVEVRTAPYPGYRVTLRNLGSRAVSNVHVQSYRGQEKAISALKRTDDGRPLMAPGGSCTIDLNLASGLGSEIMAPGTWTPRPIDLIEFDSVRWDDGTHDGRPPFPQIESLVERDSGRRLQLRRIVDALRAVLADSSAGGDLLGSAQASIDRLPDAEPDQLEAAKLAMRTTKAAVRDDLLRLPESRSRRAGDAVRDALTSLLNRYELWLIRLSPP